MSNSFNFTKAKLDLLPAPLSGRVEYNDSKTPSLKLRVTANNIKTFSVLKRIKGGTPIRQTLGKYPEMTIEQARRQAAALLSKIAEGGDPLQAKRSLKAELTFDGLFKLYLARHAEVHKKTYEEDAQRYSQYIAPLLGKRKISTIRRDEITILLSQITIDGHPVVANRILSLLSVIYNRAIEWGITKENPCTNIRRNKETSRDRFLQHDEMKRFFTALDAETNTTARDFFYLALFTGARRANVLSMEWADINLNEGVWRISMTKNGTPQNVPLSPQAINILLSRLRDKKISEQFVFAGEGRTGHYIEPRKAWVRILSAANISNLRIHDLRRTMGSWQARSGASLSVIGKSLNHKSVQTTAIYARLDMDPVRASMSTATDEMLKAAGIYTAPQA